MTRPRVVVVTGGAKGIGWATVQAFVKTGAIPVLLDRDEEAVAAAHEALSRAGVDHLPKHIDITDESAVNAAVDDVVARYGRLDVLVNNAGIALRRPTVELATADWQSVVDVNLTAVFLCCRAAARTMIAAGGGSIVNVSSIMGLSGGGLYPNVSYQSTKGAIVNMTRALAVEWASHGIRVNAVAPTWVRTELTQGLFADAGLLGSRPRHDADALPRRAGRHRRCDRLPRVRPGPHDHRPHACPSTAASWPSSPQVRIERACACARRLEPCSMKPLACRARSAPSSHRLRQMPRMPDSCLLTTAEEKDSNVIGPS
jgi:NAD(P)-dependent dehydrogenase (short-subunit alcohol dehydrogenase family)